MYKKCKLYCRTISSVLLQLLFWSKTQTQTENWKLKKLSLKNILRFRIMHKYFDLVYIQMQNFFRLFYIFCFLCSFFNFLTFSFLFLSLFDQLTCLSLFHPSVSIFFFFFLFFSYFENDHLKKRHVAILSDRNNFETRNQK